MGGVKSIDNPTNVNSNSNGNGNGNSNSPRSQAIRGSFIKLTKDLFNLNLPSITSIGDSTSGSDNDLAARLQQYRCFKVNK